MRYLFKSERLTTTFTPPDNSLELDTEDKVLAHLKTHYPDAEIVLVDPTDDELTAYYTKDADEKALAKLPAAIKAETYKRITAFLSANTRDNAVAGFTVAMATDPNFATDESKFLREFVLAGNSWIVDMRAVCQNLIKSGDSSFQDDMHWPDVPAIIADNYKKF